MELLLLNYFKQTKKCTFSLFYKKNMYDRIHILENEEIF